MRKLRFRTMEKAVQRCPVGGAQWVGVSEPDCPIPEPTRAPAHGSFTG